MDRLTKNRLIGGGVLLLTALLFLPSILTPVTSTLENPDLVIHLGAKTPALISARESHPEKTPQIKPVKPLVLESSKALPSSQTTEPNTSEHLIPITLESLPELSDSPPKKVFTNHWLQIDNFKDELTALQAANTISKKRLSTQIKVLSRDGIKTHQVLVGPFQSKQLTGEAMQTLKLLGYPAKLKQ